MGDKPGIDPAEPLILLAKIDFLAFETFLKNFYFQAVNHPLPPVSECDSHRGIPDIVGLGQALMTIGVRPDERLRCALRWF